MANAAQRLREWVEAWHRAHGEAELAWWRRGEVDGSAARIAQRLCGEPGEELLEEVTSSGELDSEQLAALHRQRAWIMAETQRLHARQPLKALASTKVICGSDALVPEALLDVLLRTDDPATGVLYVRSLTRATNLRAAELSEARAAAREVSPTFHEGDLARASEARTVAAAFLNDTDAAAQDLSAWLARSAAPRAGSPLHALALGMRARPLDAFAKPERRFLRLSIGLRSLGFERDLNARVRVERRVGPWFPFAPQVITLAAPTDVRIATPAQALGVLCDFDGAAALGGGLARALASPALGAEQRFAVGNALPEALGALQQRLRAERLYLRRAEGLEVRDAETVARHSAVLLLLLTRALAAVELAACEPARNAEERSERLAVALSRALACELPAGLAVLAWYALAPLCAELRGKLAGLALQLALRELFDEDWFENPRAAEPLRGLCARGGGLEAESACSELGASLERAASSLLEALA